MQNKGNKTGLESTKKFILSRWLIFIATLASMVALVYSELLVNYYPNLKPFDPHSNIADIIGVSICTIMVAGLYLGSRGIGQPITLKYLFFLLFTYPNRILLVPYLILIFVSIIYLEFFW